MTEIVLIILLAAVAIAAAYLFRQNETNALRANASAAEIASRDSSIAHLKSQIDEALSKERRLMEQIDVLNSRLNRIACEKAVVEERLAELNQINERLTEQSRQTFENLANRIVIENSQRMKEANELRLNEILAPFKNDVDALHKAINERFEREANDVSVLKDNIRQLRELNTSLSNEANQLTQALRGNSKVQGDWGEMILQKILEASGLQEGVNFVTQATTNADDGSQIRGENGNSLRPDVVFYLPDKKALVIDSKVSLTAYASYSDDNNPDREKFLADHLQSVRSHVDELARKNYQNAVHDSADFVMMFIPIEGAYLTAMAHDTDLWNYAYSKHVTIVSPTHLISVLKLIYQLWRRDNQTKNAVEIAKATGLVYDKLANFVKDMEDIRTNLDRASKAYDSAFNKLSSGKGNVLSRMQKIKDMGITTTKIIAQGNDESDEILP